MARAGRQDPVVIVRRREASDDDAIGRLNDVAFGGTAESKLISDLRAAGLAEVELVAAGAVEIVGHILFSLLSVTIEQRAVRALALAPMAVIPGRQRGGIGSALIRAGLTEAHGQAWQAVIVLGHPHFYPRFGFSAALATNLEAPFHGEAFMAFELVPGTLTGRGRVTYPVTFGL
jgi:putative acetyltransferase